MMSAQRQEMVGLGLVVLATGVVMVTDNLVVPALVLVVGLAMLAAQLPKSSLVAVSPIVIVIMLAFTIPVVADTWPILLRLATSMVIWSGVLAIGLVLSLRQARRMNVRQR